MPIILLCIKKYVYHFLQHILHNYKLWQKFGCLQLKVRDEKNLPVLKTTSSLLKFWRILKLADMGRTECVPKGDFGPA